MKSGNMKLMDCWTAAYLELPVKLIPASSGELVTVSPNTGPSEGRKLKTPGGTPASVMIL